jgi:hypothetical protein
MVRATCWLVATLAISSTLYLITTSGQSDESAQSTECMPYAAHHLTRHARRHRRHALLPVIRAMPRRISTLRNDTVAATWRASLTEARCLLERSSDPDLQRVVARAHENVEPSLLQFELSRNRTLVGASDFAGRRLGRWRAALSSAKAADEASTAAEVASATTGSSTTRRITRGLGVFAGADFPCDKDRDAFVGAPWSRTRAPHARPTLARAAPAAPGSRRTSCALRCVWPCALCVCHGFYVWCALAAGGACLLKCGAGSSGPTSRCANAIAVCEREPHCATIDINVEGSIATLKRETALSARTSRVKDVALTQARGDRAVGRDGPCPPEVAAQALRLRQLAGRAPTCVLDCPKLNSTRAVEVCFSVPNCVGVDITFMIEGHGAVARLRFK